MQNNMTPVELEILAEVQRRGTVTSAFGLVVIDLGREWTHSCECLRRLEQRGEIQIQRQQRGRPMIIRAVHAN